ncbi:MAG: CDP-diacylglycerol--serine O-phosphatidyltransferase [Candidatus Zixiibacteriota bacterium]
MPNYRSIFSGTFTMGNMVCGFLAILSTFHGHVTTACWIIILAAFLDAMDGKVSRLSGGSSPLGIQLDSLADFLSFGVAPAVLLQTIGLAGIGEWSWVIGVVYLMAAGYRLARFNLMADTEEKANFLGLPVPSAGVTLVSFVILCYDRWGELRYDEILIAVIVLMSFLMVSQVEYDTFPDKFNTAYNRLKLAVLVAAIAVVVFKPKLLLFPIMAGYILTGIVRELVRMYTSGSVRKSNRSSQGP